MAKSKDKDTAEKPTPEGNGKAPEAEKETQTPTAPKPKGVGYFIVVDKDHNFTGELAIKNIEDNICRISIEDGEIVSANGPCSLEEVLAAELTTEGFILYPTSEFKRGEGGKVIPK